MRADEMAERLPIVGIDTDAWDAVTLLTTLQLPGLVVSNAARRLVSIVPASQLLRILVPSYVREAPALARVLPESTADRMAAQVRGQTVRALIPDPPPELAIARDDDTIVEVAALMDRLRCPLAAVMRGDTLVGVITAARLLQLALTLAPPLPRR